MPPRPDTYYGVSKVFGEALGRLMVDRYGLEVVCLRIGSWKQYPTSVRELSTWISPADGVRLLAAALTAPDVGFAVVYGISANTRAWWDLAPARALGYLSVDDAEEYADRIPGADAEPDPAADPERGPVGGPFAGPAYDEPRLGRDGLSRLDADLRDAAERWLAEDPDPVTRDELRALLDAGDEAAVADRFAGRLEFGTAGLRGPLRAGPNGMNRAVVRRTAAGLAAWLRRTGGTGAGRGRLRRPARQRRVRRRLGRGAGRRRPGRAAAARAAADPGAGATRSGCSTRPPG